MCVGHEDGANDAAVTQVWIKARDSSTATPLAGTRGVQFVAGDRAVVTRIRDLLGPIGAVAVEDEIDDASVGRSPKRAAEERRRGAARAIRNRSGAKHYAMPSP